MADLIILSSGNNTRANAPAEMRMRSDLSWTTRRGRARYRNQQGLQDNYGNMTRYCTNKNNFNEFISDIGLQAYVSGSYLMQMSEDHTP